MQVTCPNCRARYAVDPLAIGPTGRIVQCARCSDRWFQTVKLEPTLSRPPEAGEVSVPDAPKVPRRPEAIGVPGLSQLVERLSSLSRFKPALPRFGRQRPVTPDMPRERRQEPRLDAAASAPDFVIRPPTRGAGLPALIEPRANRRISLVLAGALILLVLLVAGVVAFREELMGDLSMLWRDLPHAGS